MPVALEAPRALRVDEGYCPTPDGGQLYFRAEGEGPALVLSNGLGVSTFFWHHVVAAFAGTYRVVVWDYRGHGRSGPAPQTGFGIRTCSDDLILLMNHLDLDHAVLAGHSLGSQVILETYRNHPARVDALVPTLGGYGRTVETFFGTKLSVPALKLLARLAALRPSMSQALVKASAHAPGALEVAKLVGLVNKRIRPEEMAPYLDHLATLNLNVYFQLAFDLQAHDASDVLANIRVPTLVFGADRDLFTPVELSRRMAGRIPNAELCILRGGSHAALVEQPELVCLRLERFLVDRLGLPGMARAVA